MNVGVLVLAAGKSERFGSDKRLATLPDGRTMIEALLGNARRSGLPVLVCLNAHDDALETRLSAESIDCIRCERACEGMGGTLAEGVGHVRDWDGVLVTLADMPWILPGTYCTVANNLAPNTICQPTFSDSPGHPVGFGAAYFSELARLQGDLGARELLKAHSGHVQRVSVADPGVLRDVDRPKDLKM